MKKLTLLITVLLFPFFCCMGQQLSERDSDMYSKAFEYIKQDTFFKEKDIYVSDTIYYFQVDKSYLVDTIIGGNGAIVVSLEDKQMIKQNYDSTKKYNKGTYCKPLSKLFRKHQNNKAIYTLYFGEYVEIIIHNIEATTNDTVNYDRLIIVDIVNNGGFPAQNAYGMNWEKESYQYIFYFDENNKIIIHSNSRIINNILYLNKLY